MASKFDGKRASENFWVMQQNLAKQKGGRKPHWFQQPRPKTAKSAIAGNAANAANAGDVANPANPADPATQKKDDAVVSSAAAEVPPTEE